MPLVRFHRSTLLAQPWKNGGGVTREILCLPQGSSLSRFDWRVSIAHIASGGPFSVFAGIDRVITLLEGPGVHLRSHDGAIDHRLDTPLVPFAFPGDAHVQADLLGAGCHDFNVMTRRHVCTARVRVLREATPLPRSREGLFMAVHGRWELQGETPVRLGAGEGLWWHESGLAWRLDPLDSDAAMLAVSIEPATP
jgi:environmental stress-induced protein Ves